MKTEFSERSPSELGGRHAAELIDRPSTDAFQGEFVKHFVLQKKEMSFVVNDKEKRKHRFLQLGNRELKNINL